MSSNRKAAESFFLDFIDRLVPGGENLKIYQDLFASLNDEEFELMVQRLESGAVNFAVFIPNFGKSKVGIKNNLKLAKELGVELFQRVWVPATETTRGYLTPKKYAIVHLPLRRQAQLLDEKMSVAENNNSVDIVTGQATGASKGAKISYPELQTLVAQGLEHTCLELMKTRGGDSGAFNALNAIMDRNGSVSQAEIEPFSTGVKSTQALKHYLLGMGLKPIGL